MNQETEIQQAFKALNQDKALLSPDFTNTVMESLPRSRFSLFARLKYELLYPRSFSFDLKRSFLQGADLKETSFYFLMAAVFHFLFAAFIWIVSPFKLASYLADMFLVQPPVLFIAGVIFLSLGYFLSKKRKGSRLYSRIWLLTYIMLLMFQIFFSALQGSYVLVFSMAPYSVISIAGVLFLLVTVGHVTSEDGR